jgi:ribosome recycling factor
MNDWKPKMEKAARHLAEQLAGIRTGTLSVGFIETFRAPLRGNRVAIGRMASVTGRADRIIITPFDPAHVQAVVKVLSDARLKAYAQDPRTVVVGIPPISGEQRIELARHVKKLGDEAKVAVRKIRQDARKAIAARGRGSERAVQEATDAIIEGIERLVRAKLVELGA